MATRRQFVARGHRKRAAGRDAGADLLALMPPAGAGRTTRGSPAYRAKQSAAMRAAWAKRKHRTAQTSAPHTPTVAAEPVVTPGVASPSSAADATPIPPPAVIPREAPRTRTYPVAPRRGR